MQFPSLKYHMLNNTRTNNLLRRATENLHYSYKNPYQMLPLRTENFHNTVTQNQPHRGLLTFSVSLCIFRLNFTLTHPPTHSHTKFIRNGMNVSTFFPYAKPTLPYPI